MSRDDDKVKRFIDGFMLEIPHLKALGISYHGHGRGWSELALPCPTASISSPIPTPG